MLSRRVITAADMPAREAKAKMDPPSIRLETLLATLRRARLDVVNLLQVGAFSGHHSLLPIYVS